MHTKGLSWTAHQSHVLQHFDYPATLTEWGPLVWQVSHNKCQSAMWANQLLKMFLISCFWLEPRRGEQHAGVSVILVAAGHATLQYASFFHQLGSKYSAYDGKIQSAGKLAPDQVQDQVVQSVDAPRETATQLMAVGGWVADEPIISSPYWFSCSVFPHKPQRLSSLTLCLWKTPLKQL